MITNIDYKSVSMLGLQLSTKLSDLELGNPPIFDIYLFNTISSNNQLTYSGSKLTNLTEHEVLELAYNTKIPVINIDELLDPQGLDIHQTFYSIDSYLLLTGKNYHNTH
jgi:hypothetical protein